MQQYIDLVNRILKTGVDKTDRTGVGTRSVFGGYVEFDLEDRFPLVTVKETRWRTAFLEMLWFLRGESTTEWLNDNGCKLWDAWATNGDLGPIYGVQWRGWQGPDYGSDGCMGLESFDQITDLIQNLKFNPDSRRHIVSAWNVWELPFMALPPCHMLFQCYVVNGKLSLQVYQRSWDVALGAPFNIAQYALLTHLLARASDLDVGKLSFTYGDAHLYTNHLEAMTEVVSRGVINCTPKLKISTNNVSIDGYRIDDFAIEGYEHHPHVPLKVAV